MQNKTKVPQYELLVDVIEKHGITRLGMMINESWSREPKRMLFTLARYKFVVKMLSGKHSVLESSTGQVNCKTGEDCGK